MSFRLSGSRFVLRRSCFILLILFFLLQIGIYFNYEESLTNNPIENLYWQELQNQNQILTNEQRIKQIEYYETERKRNRLNWTNVFYDIYQRKTEKLNQIDLNNDYKYRSKLNVPNISQNQIEIFEETLVFQHPKFCSSTCIFHPECPYKNCKWSCKKSLINDENIRRANIFHYADINDEEMYEKLKLRSLNDIWILWIDEANQQLKHLNSFKFNWTISFRQDSEISIGSYGLIIPSHSNKKFYSYKKSDLIVTSDYLHILTNRSILITDTFLENYIFTSYRYRLKHALWFVSNCQPKARLKYYKQLARYFPIKAFGSCIENQEHQCNKSDQCETTQSRLALFYLAFESQTCQDYITEKFWRSLADGMIPIVFGPDKQSYLNLRVPASAFIHVGDFKSVKQLANYLYQVANDYTLYRTYFQWLNQYEIFYHTNELEPIRMCELCMRLNLQDKMESRFYKNIHQWYQAGC